MFQPAILLLKSLSGGVAMQVRQAEYQDLDQLKAMYHKIVAHMRHQGLFVWDEVYPCARFSEDIRAERLFVLEQNGCMVAAFALYDEHPADPALKWQDPHASALYLARLGVTPGLVRTGLGSRALHAAMDLARTQGAQWLRLFVVDNNLPALAFYDKNGLTRVNGCRIDDVGTGTLRELAFEIPLI